MKLSLKTLLKYLNSRDDIIIIGTDLMACDVICVKSTSYNVQKIMNPNGFQPFESISLVTAAVGFAIDIVTPKSKPTKSKIDWVQKWRRHGCMYIPIEDMEDIKEFFNSI